MVQIDAVLSFCKYLAFASLLPLAFFLGRATKPGIHNYSDRLSTKRKQLKSIKRNLQALSNLKTASTFSLICLWSGHLAIHSFFFFDHIRLFSDFRLAQCLFQWLRVLWLPLAILFLAKLSFYLLRKAIDKMSSHLLVRVGRLRNDEENYVKNVLNDLGEDLSRAIRELQAKELSEDNKQLKRLLQSFEAAANEQGSEISIKQNKIEAYNRFFKSLEEFAWCSDCICECFDHQELALNPLPARLFEKPDLNEASSTKSHSLKVENLNIEKNSIKTSKSDTLNPAKSSKCNRKCISHYLSLYEASKKSLESSLEKSNPLFSKVTSFIPQILLR